MYQQLLLIGMMIIALFAIILGGIIIEAIHSHPIGKEKVES